VPITIRVPDRIARGTMGPSLLLFVLTTPMLVTYLSGVDPADLWPSLSVPSILNQGQIVLLFLAFLSFAVGYLSREPRRAIQVFTLSQVLAFSVSIVVLFVYPQTSEGLALVKCFPNCGYDQYPYQLISNLYIFVAGFAILVVVIGIAMAALGSYAGERFGEQTGDR
jgi:hypothetical protein